METMFESNTEKPTEKITTEESLIADAKEVLAISVTETNMDGTPTEKALKTSMFIIETFRKED
jgi:hypothetical protein